MRCKRVKELLITDYIDNELDLNLRREVEAHAYNCKGCKEYMILIREKAVSVLEGANSEIPPDDVWKNIKESITADKSKACIAGTRWISNLRPAFNRGVFAFAATAAILIMIVSFTVNRFSTERLVNTYLNKQVDFLYNLNGYNGNGEPLIGSVDFGTGIEEYFL